MRKTDVTVKIIFRYKNKALIMRHRNGIFDFPGGRIEFGESPLAALKRELKEELSYSLTKNPKFLNVWNYLPKNKRRHSIFLTYVLRVSRKPKMRSSEKANLLWLTKKEFLDRRVLKNKKFVQTIFD
jgi:8-oxo-dGTP diphosphatase